MRLLFCMTVLLLTVHGGSTQCISGDLKLMGGSSTGILQICKGSVWKNVCRNDWGNLNAAVACRQLGHDGGYTQTTSTSSFEALTDTIEYHCYGHEDTLQACYSHTYSSCSGGVTLVCVNGSSADPCTNGDIRLWGGQMENEGNIEICNDYGVWSAVYDYYWDYSDAFVACRQLNYRDFITFVYTGSVFGERIQPAEYGGLNCQGTESSLKECSVISSFVTTYSELAYSNEREYAGVKCISKGEVECIDGDVRLQHGFSDNNGLAEICIDGTWIGVCQSSGEQISSFICRQLGYIRYTSISDRGFFQWFPNRNESLAFISSFSCSSDSAILLDCVRTYSYGVQYIPTCTPHGVLCCPNDITSCSITSPPATMATVSSTTVVSTEMTTEMTSMMSTTSATEMEEKASITATGVGIGIAVGVTISFIVGVVAVIIIKLRGQRKALIRANERPFSFSAQQPYPPSTDQTGKIYKRPGRVAMGNNISYDLHTADDKTETIYEGCK